MTGVDVYCLQELVEDPDNIEIFQKRIHAFINALHYYGWQFAKGKRSFVAVGVEDIQEAQDAAEDWFRHFGGTDFFDDVGEVSMAVRLGHKTWLTDYITVH